MWLLPPRRECDRGGGPSSTLNAPVLGSALPGRNDPAAQPRPAHPPGHGSGREETRLARASPHSLSKEAAGVPAPSPAGRLRTAEQEAIWGGMGAARRRGGDSPQRTRSRRRLPPSSASRLNCGVRIDWECKWQLKCNLHSQQELGGRGRNRTGRTGQEGGARRGYRSGGAGPGGSGEVRERGSTRNGHQAGRRERMRPAPSERSLQNGKEPAPLKGCHCIRHKPLTPAPSRRHPSGLCS